MRLYLIRHGATEYSASGRYAGQRDIPLSPIGQTQAALLARRLATWPIATIVTSDLLRASQTAAAIGGALGCVPVLDPDLREVAQGKWEGRTHAEAAAQDPEFYRDWQADSFTTPFPGGESAADVLHRMVRALDRWYDPDPARQIAWIGHGGALMLLLSHLLGMDPRRRWQLRLDPAALSEVDIGPDPATTRYAILMRHNDTAHV